MIKRAVSVGVGMVLLASPLLRSAQTVSASSNNAALIAVLTQLVQILEQELQQLLAAQGNTTTTQTTATTQTNTQSNAVIQPSASIDQSSLTTSSGVPTITGSASGVYSVFVTVTAGTNQVGTATQTGIGEGDASNGRWSATIYPKGANAFTAGIYTVTIYNDLSGLYGPVLATGTLSILGNALQPTAIITGVNGAGSFGTGTNNQVYGTNFTGATPVYLANSSGMQTPLTFTVMNDTELTNVVVPNLSGDFYTLTIANGNGASAAYNVGWLGPMAKPSISSVNGAGSFGPGSNNQIIGQNFLQVNNVYLVSASGVMTNLTYTVANSTQINVVVPSLPSGSYTLYVSTSAGQTAFAVRL